MIESKPVFQKTYTFKMAGITMHDYDRDKLEVGMRVKLVREPDNPYDPNAIRIQDKEGEMIAYVPKVVAKSLAPALDAKAWPYQAFAILVEDGDLTVWGVRLNRFAWPTP